MTVGELILEMQKQDPTLPVYREDHEYGPEPVEGVRIYERRTEDFPVGKVVRAVLLVIE